MPLDSLVVYLKLIESELSRLRGRTEGCTLDQPPTRREFLATIELLEVRGEFSALANEFEREFGQDKRIRGLWQHQLKAFFRLSGIYEGAFSKETLPLEELHAVCKKEFEQTTAEVTSLAPIEFVEFSDPYMEFDSFAIRRFSKKELDDLLRQHACALFFPWAALDTYLLSSYSFIVSKEDQPILNWVKWAWNENVQPRYSPFSGRLKEAFRTLTLYRWRERSLDDVNLLVAKAERGLQFSSIYPNVPFTIHVSSSLRDSPPKAPDLSKLATQELVNVASGQEIGTSRIVVFEPSEFEPPSFFQFARDTATVLRRVSQEQEWRFIDTALNFLEKGFIDKGLDQLLWHITVVEALLGEKVDSGLTTLLKTRVGLILGSTEKEQKAAKKIFESLYSLRSDYIHGNVKLTEREILYAELAQAREIARKASIWMLSYLNHVLIAQAKDADILPSREDLLAVLDMDVSTRNHTARLLSSLPQDFPRVVSWSDKL